MHALARRLYPVHRAQTGKGVRETLRILSELMPLAVHEIPSGTAVLDWTVPQEWRLHDAYVADSEGNRVIDVRATTLHLVNGSRPVRARMMWSELVPHLHTLPEQPDLVPYVTGFFRDMWGFCLSQREFDRLAALGDREYEVVIDAELFDGSLTYGEWVLPGESDDEILLWTHCCHPSLANDNLSGTVVAAHLARRLAGRPRRLGIRIVVAPATIGAIAWLATNNDILPRIRHGLVLSLLGDDGDFTYKCSRAGNLPIDRAVEHVLRGSTHELRDFVPWGYDERQFASPGFDLPVGALTRTAAGEFPQYHTSADDLDFITPEALEGSLDLLEAVIDVLEHDATYRNLRPHGEPMLGRHGLYETLPDGDRRTFQRAVQWVLNLSDGTHSLLAIAERAGLPFAIVRDAAERLEGCGLLACCEEAL